MSDQGPTVFGGRYELHRRLARGGMADVFLGRDQLLDRPVAIKVLFREFATDPNFVERFKREAQAAANLTHPNIVSVYDWGRESGTYYIVMEYVEGRSLAEVIRARGAIPPDRAATIAFEVAAALGFAHKGGVVHRDVKGSNIILSPGGGVKVADFGIATAITGGAGASLTQTGLVMGTATYFSPEQAQGKPVDQRSDLYSLGIVLYEMLTGHPPFEGDSSVAIAYKHVQEAPVPPRQLVPQVPESLEAITLKLLAKDPAVRYPTAADLQSDLRRYLEGEHTLGGAAAAGAAPAPRPVVPAPAPAATQALPPVDGPPRRRPPTGPAPYTERYDDGPVGPREPVDRRIWWYALAVVGLLAVLVALIVVILNQLNGGDGGSDAPPVNVPDVVTRDLQTAIDLLEAVGLQAGEITREQVADATADTVLAQDPVAGTEVDSGSTVNLTVAVGPDAVPVPDVVGRTVEEATTILEEAGFVVDPRDVADEAELGTVVKQEPPANTDLAPGETVLIEVSAGPDEVDVPDVDNRTVEEAKTILEEAGFTTSERPEASDTVPEGSVIRTEPDGGGKAPEGSEIVLFVSTGPESVAVPVVLGFGEADASAAISAVGLVPVVGQCTITDPATQVPGTVIVQTPTAGTEVTPGSQVQLCIGVAAATPTPEPTATEVPTPPPTDPPTPTPEPTATPLPPTETPIPTDPPPPPTATPTG